MRVERALVLREGSTKKFCITSCERAFGSLDVFVREFAEELLRVGVAGGVFSSSEGGTFAKADCKSFKIFTVFFSPSKSHKTM